MANERLATLSEIKQYAEQGMDIAQLIQTIETQHGVVKIFDHSPSLMAGQKFRYFVMPLTSDGEPVVNLAKGANIQ